MEILSLDTLEEAEFFYDLGSKNIDNFEQFTHIGGYTSVGKSLNSWRWVNSGQLIDYPMKFDVNEPNFKKNFEFCLDLVRRDGKLYLNDAACYEEGQYKFVCQREHLTVAY